MRHRLALRCQRALLPDGDCAYAVGVACLVVVPRWLYAPQPLIAALLLLLPLFAVHMLRNLYLLSCWADCCSPPPSAWPATGASATASPPAFSDDFHSPAWPISVVKYPLLFWRLTSRKNNDLARVRPRENAVATAPKLGKA